MACQEERREINQCMRGSGERKLMASTNRPKDSDKQKDLNRPLLTTAHRKRREAASTSMAPSSEKTPRKAREEIALPAKKSPRRNYLSAAVAISYSPAYDPRANVHLASYHPPSDRPIRIYCDGIYDLFHYGHSRSLEQAKHLFPNTYLLVGVCNDADTHRRKGRTVFNEAERAESIRHCRWVDEVIENAPWTVNDAFIREHRIDFVAHDDLPYGSEGTADVYAHLKAAGQFIATRRTSGISTSDIITRIVRDYDTYIRRNLERGIPARDLNLSFLHRQRLSLTSAATRLRHRLLENEQDVRKNWQSTRDEIVATLASWEAKSQEWIREFALLFSSRGARIFGRDGELRLDADGGVVQEGDSDEKTGVRHHHSSVVDEEQSSEDEAQGETSSLSGRIKQTVMNAIGRLTASPPPPQLTQD